MENAEQTSFQTLRGTTLTVPNELLLKKEGTASSEAVYHARQLIDNFGKVIQNRELIINDPRFYLIRLPGLLNIALMGIGDGDISLGVWLEAIDNAPSIRIDEAEDTKYLLKAGGSFGSGYHSVWFWSHARQEIINEKNYFNFWLDWYVVLRTLSKTNTLRLEKNQEAIRLLLSDERIFSAP